MKTLQIKTATGWKHVFCRNAQTNKVILTDNPSKALRERDLEWFSSKFGNDSFRVSSTLD